MPQKIDYPPQLPDNLAFVLVVWQWSVAGANHCFHTKAWPPLGRILNCINNRAQEFWNSFKAESTCSSQEAVRLKSDKLSPDSFLQLLGWPQTIWANLWVVAGIVNGKYPNMPVHASSKVEPFWVCFGPISVKTLFANIRHMDVWHPHNIEHPTSIGVRVRLISKICGNAKHQPNLT